jgi:uncharacterized protein YqjF (DUF2071 family)
MDSSSQGFILPSANSKFSMKQAGENNILSNVGHRPWPLPETRWVMTQRWNDLLFAHWPLPAVQIAPLLPPELAVDAFDGAAWVGVVPFWMDRIQIRGLPIVPGANRFPELNLRTYVREAETNRAGVYFFSLDAANPVAVAMARMFFHLPYYWAKMSIEHRDKGEFFYSSQRRLAGKPVRFRAAYRGLGRMNTLDQSRPGTIEYFLTERYALYTRGTGGKLHRGNIHHMPWPLELAEAEFELNELPSAHGINLPETAPILHYARELVVYVWSLELAPSLLKRPVVAAVPEPL